MGLISRDLQYNWHPCAQMKDYESFPPLEIKSAEGAYLTLANGQKVVDAISSWWCKSLGHKHPVIMDAMQTQMQHLCHTLFANTTHETLVNLSEQLCQLVPGMHKVFYASDGSCAVEIALKMSLQARSLQGQTHRTQFISLQNAYHGETLFAMAVSDCDLYKQPFAHTLPVYPRLENLPYVSGVEDDIFQNCEMVWPVLEKQLAPLSETATAVIVEPIVQGGGGMLIYSADILRRLRVWCDAHDVHLIADEIMTGVGRTGKMFACEYANVLPDFMCVAKGLTSGELPLSCVLTQNKIYDLFYDTYESGKAFMHSHTHSGNVLAASVACAALKVMREEHILEKVGKLQLTMRQQLTQIAKRTGCLKNIRGIGGMVAADIDCDPSKRMGYAVFQQAIKEGAWLRPLGNTLYWFPPLNIDDAALAQLIYATEQALVKIVKG